MRVIDFVATADLKIKSLARGAIAFVKHCILGGDHTPTNYADTARVP
jgi:hypothetical protein